MRGVMLSLVLSGCCVDCSGGDVHSNREKSVDGGTELIAGPFSWKCTAKIDGKPVTQGVPVAVKPGVHRVECDTDSIEVDVTRGTSVTVDYFGP